MRTIPLFLVAVIGLMASCDDDSTSSSENASFPAHRDIPASLRKTCPELPASRAAGGTTDAPATSGQNVVEHVSYGIYDTAGALVAQGKQDITVPDYAVGYAPNIGWTGKDAAGNSVPTGHYFVFIEVRNDAGTLVGSDAVCIGMISNS